MIKSCVKGGQIQVSISTQGDLHPNTRLRSRENDRAGRLEMYKFSVTLHTAVYPVW